MALLWQKRVRGNLYEVRRAGNSLRLYTDGLFHSQWNAHNPVCGQLWELLVLPVFFREDMQTVKRILVLGVGGGAVINFFNRYLQVNKILGIDLDKTHLQIARRWFGVRQDNTQLVEYEASAWVDHWQGEKFDLIVEDLFVSDASQEPVRAISANDRWFRSLRRLLNKNGLLVMNFESTAQARRAWRVNSGFAHARVFSSHKYDNGIAVFSGKILDLPAFNVNLREHKELDRRRKSCKLDFRCIKLG